MNEIVRKFILPEYRFMYEIHFRRPGFTCSACGTFRKNKERIQKFIERNIRFVYLSKRSR